MRSQDCLLKWRIVVINSGKDFMDKQYGLAFYVVIGALLAVGPLPLFWAGYLCVKGGEYWPLILFGITTSLAWLAAANMFRNALKIKRAKRNGGNQ